MAGSVWELHDGTRVSRGEHGRLTLVRRFMVDLRLGGTTTQITPEYAPYVVISSDGQPGVPQLGTSEDLRNATQFLMEPMAGFVPGVSRLWMIGFRTLDTTSPYHVIVECEFDNFTLGKFRSLSVSPTNEEWPVFQRQPMLSDVAAGPIVRYIWSLQTLKFMTSRSILQVRMKLKVLPEVLQAQLASEAGKVHFFDGQYWMFDGAQAAQLGESTSGEGRTPVWDIRYQWMNDPGFAGYSISQNPALFAPGAVFDPELSVVPVHQYSTGPVSLTDTYREPFWTYVKVPQKFPVNANGTPPAGATPQDIKPRIVITPNANWNLNGWQTLPGNPLLA